MLGAFGHLHCVEIDTGRIAWKRHLYREFGAEALVWGATSAPLIIGKRLIVNPGGKNASLVALDVDTGREVWRTPGHAAAYAAFIDAQLDGVRQIIGYDSASLGGWDPVTGKRLWTHVPRGASDFNVATPVVIGNRVLLATENNGTRLVSFDGKGHASATPAASNEDFAPDTCTPVVVGNRAYGAAYGELYCLDVEDGLRTVWVVQNDMFYDHVNVIAGKDRVLAWTMSGDLLLLRTGTDKYDVVSHLRPFGSDEIDSMSHPAIVDSAIFLRAKGKLACLSTRMRF